MYIDIDYIKCFISDTDITALLRDNSEPEYINFERLTAMINVASNIVDSYIKRAGYVVPILNYDNYIQHIAFKIFRHLIYARKYNDEEYKKTVIYQEYIDTVNELTAIAEGRIPVSGAERLSQETALLISNKVSNDRKFTDWELR
jgi:phage gp36-like protein